MPRRAVLAILVLCAARARGGDIQVGPDVPEAARPSELRRAPAQARPRASGIYPVYEIDGRWALLERDAKSSRRPIRQGASFLVVGSEAAGLAAVTKSFLARGAACEGQKPVTTQAYRLESEGAERLGTPIIAIRVSGAEKLDLRLARFSRLDNQVDETAYASLDKAIREAVVTDLRSGDFLVGLDDAAGQALQRDPRTDKIYLKIDFGSGLRLAGARRAFVLVEGVQISKTYRRCMRLALGDRLAGGCAEMPHALMAETAALEFVAYDPNGDGRPFVLAYTPKEPLWGHERWGFRITQRGPRRFLMDAMDPKCRERF